MFYQQTSIKSNGGITNIVNVAQSKFNQQNKFPKVFFKNAEKSWNQDASQKVQCVSGFIIRPRYSTSNNHNMNYMTPDPEPTHLNTPTITDMDSNSPSAEQQNHTGNQTKASFHTQYECKLERKPKSGCEVIFYSEFEFSGTMITYPMQIKYMQELLREYFEKLKDKVE